MRKVKHGTGASAKSAPASLKRSNSKVVSTPKLQLASVRTVRDKWDETKRCGDVVQQVVAELCNIHRRSRVFNARRVGEVVFKKIFEGDISAVEKQGRKAASFRRLASHPDVPYSGATLWRNVGIYCLIERLPGFAKPKHIGVAHLRAVLGLPVMTQEQLLRAAEVEQWPVERLLERVAIHRPKRGAGRKPQAPAVRSIWALDRLAKKFDPADDLVELTELDAESARSAEESLEQVRAWCERAVKALRSRVAAVA